MERKTYSVIAWSNKIRGYKLIAKGLVWEDAKSIREHAKQSMNFPHNPDIEGIEIHSDTVCAKNGII